MTGPSVAAPQQEKQQLDNEERGDPGRAGPVREAIPQILATCAKNMLLLDIGMTLAFPTIVIGALLQTSQLEKEGADEQQINDPYGLTFDVWQASWFGSLMLICQPFGSIMSGLLLEPLGRKRAMLLVNAPHLLAWLLLATAREHSSLFSAAAIMGLGMGFMEAPIITYVGEISTPKLRGALTSMAGISVMLGYFLEFLLGTLCPWRVAAWASVSVPILTILAISQVPESPIWLVSKGRVSDAERALCWLRGWVQSSAVQTELSDLLKYNFEMASKNRGAAEVNKGIVNVGFISEGTEIKMPANDNSFSKMSQKEPIETPKHAYLDGVRAVARRETRRPLLLVVAFFVIHHWTGISGLRPYMVPLFKEFGLPIDAHWLTVLTALLGMGGNILCMVSVAWSGKRPLALASIAGVGASCLMLGGYRLSMAEVHAGETNWIPLLLFISLFSFHSFGIGPIPWMILSEVFPYQGRGMATGIAAAASYVLGFCATKTFLDIQSFVGLSGIFLANGIIAALGFVFMWFWLPETEGRTLQEIETFYAKKKKETEENPNIEEEVEKTAL